MDFQKFKLHTVTRQEALQNKFYITEPKFTFSVVSSGLRFSSSKQNQQQKQGMHANVTNISTLLLCIFHTTQLLNGAQASLSCHFLKKESQEPGASLLQEQRLKLVLTLIANANAVLICATVFTSNTGFKSSLLCLFSPWVMYQEQR